MNTEKKKRIPKPQKGVSTEFLLNHCLQFLNLKEADFDLPKEDAQYDSLRIAVREILTSLAELPQIGSLFWQDRFESDFFRNSEARRELNFIWNQTRKLVDITVNVDSMNTISELPLMKFMCNLKMELKFLFGNFVPTAVIGLIGLEGILCCTNQEQFNNKWTLGLPSIILMIVISGLSDGVYHFREPTEPGSLDVGRQHTRTSAAAYIGYCPECKIVFSKKRKDQFFCSERCAENLLKRTKRKNKTK